MSDVFHAEGQVFDQPNLSIYGNNNTVRGPNCKIIGDKNTITAPNCEVTGDDNIVSGPNCTVNGNHNNVTGVNCSVSGESNSHSSGQIRVLNASMTPEEFFNGRYTQGTSDAGPHPAHLDLPFKLNISGSVGAMGLGVHGTITNAVKRIAEARAKAETNRQRAAKTRSAVSRLSPASILISGNNGPTNRIAGGRVFVNGVEFPSGVRIGSQVSTAEGTVLTGLSPELVASLVNSHGESSDSSAPAPTLESTLETFKGKDKDATDEDEGKECSICFERLKCIALNPCGHTVLCVACALTLVKNSGTELTCPICNGDTTTVAFVRL